MESSKCQYLTTKNKPKHTILFALVSLVPFPPSALSHLTWIGVEWIADETPGLISIKSRGWHDQQFGQHSDGQCWRFKQLASDHHERSPVQCNAPDQFGHHKPQQWQNDDVDDEHGHGHALQSQYGTTDHAAHSTPRSSTKFGSSLLANTVGSATNTGRSEQCSSTSGGPRSSGHATIVHEPPPPTKSSAATHPAGHTGKRHGPHAGTGKQPDDGILLQHHQWPPPNAKQTTSATRSRPKWPGRTHGPRSHWWRAKCCKTTTN